MNNTPQGAPIDFPARIRAALSFNEEAELQKFVADREAGLRARAAQGEPIKSVFGMPPAPAASPDVAKMVGALTPEQIAKVAHDSIGYDGTGFQEVHSGDLRWFAQCILAAATRARAAVGSEPVAADRDRWVRIADDEMQRAARAEAEAERLSVALRLQRTRLADVSNARSRRSTMISDAMEEIGAALAATPAPLVAVAEPTNRVLQSLKVALSSGNFNNCAISAGELNDAAEWVISRLASPPQSVAVAEPEYSPVWVDKLPGCAPMYYGVDKSGEQCRISPNEHLHSVRLGAPN